MAAFITRTAINGKVNAQDVVSILWYYVDSTGITYPQLAGEVNDTVDTEVVPSWLAAVSNLYEMVSLTTHVFSNLWVNLTPSGVTKPIGSLGGVGGGIDGAAHALHLKAVLDLTFASTAPSGRTVRKGSLYPGPLPNAAVGTNDEFLAAGIGNAALANIKTVLAQGYAAHGLITGDMWPLRVSLDHPDGFKLFARVSAWTEDYYVTHLDTRARDH